MPGTLLTVLISILWQALPEIANRFNGYLILGYLVMWAIALVYIISLASRQRNLQQDIRLMQKLLQEEAFGSEDH